MSHGAHGRGVIDLRRVKPQRREVPRPSARRGAGSRTSPLRVRRRRNQVIALIALFILFGTLAYGIHWASYLPALTIDKVIVDGVREVPQDIVRTYVQARLDDGSYRFISNSNIFAYPKESISRSLMSDIPRIKNAHLARASLFSRELIVVIEERRPYAKWCRESDDCYSMDDAGYIFAEASTTRTQALTEYIFRGGLVATSTIGTFFSENHLPGMKATLEQLTASNFHAVGATVDSDSDFSIAFSEGYYVKASQGTDALTLVKNLQLILGSADLRDRENDIEYIDLRFGNRVYYKLKGAVYERTE